MLSYINDSVYYISFVLQVSFLTSTSRSSARRDRRRQHRAITETTLRHLPKPSFLDLFIVVGRLAIDRPALTELQLDLSVRLRLVAGWRQFLSR